MSDLRGVEGGPRLAVLTLSDRSWAGEREDLSGPLLAQMALDGLGGTLVCRMVLPDLRERISLELSRLADQEGCDLILTTGGTGLSPHDQTPEATADVTDRMVPGLAELVRSSGQSRTPRAALHRGLAGIRGRTLIVNLSGSPRAVTAQMEALLPVLPHALESLRGSVTDCAR